MGDIVEGMNDAREQGAPRPESWREQTSVRDLSLDAFIADFVSALAQGRLDDADRLGRSVALAEVMTRGIDLHGALSERSGGRAEDLLDDERPGILMVVAVARLEAAGDIGVMHRPLRAAARTLIAAATDTVSARARNLSLAAVAFALVGDDDRSFEIANRASDLVAEMCPGEEGDDFVELTAAASDLAIAYMFAEHYMSAARMWRWVRAHIVDPRIPALMQADWGLAIVGVISGDRSLVSPLTRSVLHTPVPEGQESMVDDEGPHHLWWALVQSARAWTALDDYRAQDALQITRHAVAAVMIPTRIAPLASVHAVALIAEGRPAAALAHLQRQHDAASIDASPNRWRRAVITLIAASLSGSDV